MTLQVMKNGISFTYSDFYRQFFATHLFPSYTLLHFLLKGIVASVRFFFLTIKLLTSDFQSLLVFNLLEPIHMYFLQS